MSRPFTLITGGTRGIGAATARTLVAAGHDLVLGYARDDTSAQALADEVRADGGSCLIVKADLTDPGAVERLFAAAAEFGALTGVVNNAGATMHIAPLAETPVDVISRSIALNLVAPLLVARAAVRALGTSYGGAGGVLVNVSSGAATLGSPREYVHYAAAKAGIDAMTLGLSQEVADQGVRVVGVAPGHIRTRVHADAGDPDRVDRLAPTIPLGRPGEPVEVADAIAWLMSDSAAYITGTTLRVAGGR